MNKTNTFKNFYTLINPGKYVGSNAPYFRSSWEARLMYFFDTNPHVLAWGSEMLSIEYLHPHTNRVHRYIPDLFVKYQDRDGGVITEIIEVKPKEESSFTEASTPEQRAQVEINAAKWAAAEAYAQSQGARFRVMNQHHIYQVTPKAKKPRRRRR
jgi:hypothetical protein